MATKKTPWRDETSYSKCDNVKTPRVWVIGDSGAKVTVHRWVGLEGWFLTSGALGLDKYALQTLDVEDAKRKALVICSARLANQVAAFAKIGVKP